MSTDGFWTPPGESVLPPTRSAMGELFEFVAQAVGVAIRRCEFPDHCGDTTVREAQFFQDEWFLIARTFGPWLHPGRTPREMAIGWAEEIRKEMKKG